jgi:hypothetical protein
MKYVAGLVLALAAVAARADAPDLKTYTCKAYLDFTMKNMSGGDVRAQQAVGLQMAWLVGYLSGEHRTTLMDAERLRQVIHDVNGKCQARPSALLLTAAEEAWAAPSAAAR